MSLLLDALLKEKLITEEQLSDARAKHMGAKRPIQELLVEMGFVREEDLLRVSSQVFKTSVVDLSKETVDAEAIKLIPYDLAKRYGVFPVKKTSDTLIIAMTDPQDIVVLDDLRHTTNLKIKPILCAKSAIDNAIEEQYHVDDTIYDILKNVSEDAKIKLIKDDGTIKEKFGDDSSIIENAPVVRLVNLVFHDAVRAKASDIHIEPQEKIVKIRYRIDGELKNIMDVPSALQYALAARIKILAALDIAETRKPQDGRAKLLVSDNKIDLRISTIPTFHGEKVEIRILDPKEAKVELDAIGFTPDELKTVKETIVRPQGIVLVTGPTGSGKTSTLYSILNYIKSETKNIVTIEDPVEYLMPGINQIQVNPFKDVTFATGLRSILRQDPNVILVGEIRDKETADIAFRASLTGHLVFSTLHTNNAVGSITRLIDIGLESYLVASSLILVISQRLVRVICPHCKEAYTPQENLITQFKSHIDEFHIKVFYRGKGCPQCDFSGFHGRTAIFEIFKINDEIRKLITNRAAEEQIASEAKKIGLKSLIKSGMERVAQGITTLEDVLKIVGAAGLEGQGLAVKPVGSNLKALIADDDEDILAILSKRLKDAGFEVVLTRDGNEALEYVHKEKPDIIITDATMPKMNGFELVKAVREHLDTAVIPIIMLTAGQDKASELKGFDAGADDYIVKPFDHEKLLARVKILLKRAGVKNV